MQRLGQHFLKDKSVLKRIASSLEIKPNETIIEIGPGHGELTSLIIQASPKKIITIERDKKLATEVEKLDTSGVDLEVIEGDAIKIIPTIPKILNPRPTTANEEQRSALSHSFATSDTVGSDGAIAYKIAGNIPYYITGKLLRIIGELEEKPQSIVLTIQKEVAERICATPPKMNLLAASIIHWGKPEIIKFVSRNAFRPKPKVESAIIRIIPHERQPTPERSEAYYKFIKILFKQPRKNILNNLASGLPEIKKEVELRLKSLGIEPKLRPQNLDVNTINIISHDFPI